MKSPAKKQWERCGDMKESQEERDSVPWGRNNQDWCACVSNSQRDCFYHVLQSCRNTNNFIKYFQYVLIERYLLLRTYHWCLYFTDNYMLSSKLIKIYSIAFNTIFIYEDNENEADILNVSVCSTVWTNLLVMSQYSHKCTISRMILDRI